MNIAAHEYVMVYVVAANMDEARSIANVLVASRLAACVNILGSVTSVYRWEGKIEEATEVVLVAKTQAALFDDVRGKVKDIHSYAVPCIVAYPMADGHGPYLNWIHNQT
ncbi:MAG: divalent-cation tolerance protein CutA [Rhodospirillaceae bacterium]|nr:divalent-cation tolerance protein CutA [Rhodospirillaceae bacterium]